VFVLPAMLEIGAKSQHLGRAQPLSPWTPPACVFYIWWFHWRLNLVQCWVELASPLPGWWEPFSLERFWGSTLLPSVMCVHCVVVLCEVRQRSNVTVGECRMCCQSSTVWRKWWYQSILISENIYGMRSTSMSVLLLMPMSTAGASTLLLTSWEVGDDLSMLLGDTTKEIVVSYLYLYYLGCHSKCDSL